MTQAECAAAQEDSIFKAQWDIYQAVLEGDHLEHTKLYGKLVDFLRGHLQVGLVPVPPPSGAAGSRRAEGSGEPNCRC